MTMAELLKLDTCAVSDALDKLGLTGTVTGLRALTGPFKLAGRVVTVKLVRATQTEAKATRHLCTAAIESASPGDVIVVEHRSRDDCAGWGGILSLAAKVKGISGSIVDGMVRDVDEAREAGYPLFARGAVPFTARGRIVEGSWNEPIEIGGVAVSPGDFVIADGSGVVFLDETHASDILEVAKAIALRERAMAEAVREGNPVSRVMGGDYETMLGDGQNG
jgi:4-hydroxy-4-methyl-2-oxoglutarate aldolase